MGDTVFFLSAMLSRTSAVIFSKPDDSLLTRDFFCLVWRVFHGMFIEKFAPSYLKQSLLMQTEFAQSLDLSNQRLETLPEAIFAHNPDVERLVIGDTFTAETDTTQELLDRDWRYGNMLKSLSPKIATLKRLKHVDLRGNWLETLSLNGMDKLEYLNVERNFLREVELNNLPRLEVVNCYRNDIELLRLSDLHSLKTLRLGENSLRHITLENFPSLEQVSLQWNKLQSVELRGLPNLVSLDLSNNRLTHLHLHELPRLQRLNVTKNFLQSLILSDLPTLHSVYQQDNFL